MTEEPESTHPYTIDELAAKTGVPSRTIRFYQQSGALPKPHIRGRVAYYGEEHIDRLKLVADLQDRGLRMKAIVDLVGKIDEGEVDLGEWLGFEAQLQAPWSEDGPRVVSESDLQAMIGGKRPGVVAELVRLKLIERQGDAFLIRSPGLLQVATKLEKAGVDLETAATGASIIRKHAARAARDLSEFFFKNAAEGFGREATIENLREAFRALRPMSQEALRLTFGQEMERMMRELIESGKAAKLSARRRKNAKG